VTKNLQIHGLTRLLIRQRSPIYWGRINLPPTSIPSTGTSSSELPDLYSSAIAPEVSPPARLDFSLRAHLTELMDEPCSYEELRACLHDIARVNRLTFAYRPTISWLDELIAAHPHRGDGLRVVDVGCGYGDMLRRIHRWAKARGVEVELTGVDLNPDAIRAAKEATPTAQRIQWRVGDALSGDGAVDADVVVSSLLTHHLSDPQIVALLRWMERTAHLGWFVNDLHRQAVPYHLFRFVSPVLKLHRFVRNDGPVSIRRSFVTEDWRRLCAAAGLVSGTASIREHRPARLCVRRIK
jgi:SAM-dependent methyltransferase